jgi:hypothetical protein
MVGMYPCARKGCDKKEVNGRCTIYGYIGMASKPSFYDPKDCPDYTLKKKVGNDCEKIGGRFG